MVSGRRQIFYDADPAKTILHTDINIVRHLFYLLKHDQKPFLFFYGDEKFECVVLRLDSMTVDLRVPGFRRKSRSIRTRIHFEVNNGLFHFDVQILSSRATDVTIAIPHEIHSAHRRKNKRVDTPSLFMHFTILYSPLFKSKSREQEIEARFPHFMREIRSDSPSVKLLNYMISEEALRLAEDYEMVFYKDLDELGPVEYKIMGSKKSVYVSDTTRLATYIDPLDSDLLVNFHDEYMAQFNRVGEIETLKRFEEMKKVDSRNFLVSYLYCPIIQFNDVIGHIKLYTTYFSPRHISVDDALWFTSMMDLFNYGITKSHILNTRYSIGAQETQVVNISLDGILFELEDENLYNYLHYHRRIKMNIPIFENMLEISAEVVRTFFKDGLYYMAAIFFKSKPEDMARLEQYIYEESRETVRT